MSDNIEINAATLPDRKNIRTEDIAGVHFQHVKLALGGAGVNGGPVEESNPVPVYEPAKTATNVSGVIATGGVSQVFAAANSCLHGLFVINNSGGSLWINDVTAATMTYTSIELKAGDYFQLPYGTDHEISIIGATTGQSFTARAW